jgi:hypothetical protein
LNSGIELDQSRYPLVIMHASASYTQADWNDLMKGMIDLIKRGPFGLINDTRGSALPDPLQRRSIAQMYTDYERDVRKNFLASGIVGSSSFVSGVITALNWLKPYPHPVKMFASVESAEDWVLSHFSSDMRHLVTNAVARRAPAPPT